MKSIRFWLGRRGNVLRAARLGCRTCVETQLGAVAGKVRELRGSALRVRGRWSMHAARRIRWLQELEQEFVSHRDNVVDLHRCQAIGTGDNLEQ